jgi:hypothetical protein
MTVGTKLAEAAQSFQNACSAATLDFSEGIGSFITGDHARTHDAAPVEELDADGRTKKQAEAAAAEKDGQLNNNLTDLTGTQQPADRQDAQQQPAREKSDDYGL